MKGKVCNITRLRINSDGDGVRSVVFFYECPLSCLWCCNPETRFGNKFKFVSVNQLYDLIKRDQIYFDATRGGVTFSGGEPLCHTEYICLFLKKYGRFFNANIETSLYSSFDNIKKLIPLINEWYIDFKVFDEEKHVEYTGFSNKIIKENLIRLSDIVDCHKIIVTYPLVPGYNDSADNVDKMISFMKKNGLKRVEIHPYRKNSEIKNEYLGLKYITVDEVSMQTVNIIKGCFLEEGIEVIERDVVTERSKCSFLKDIRRSYCEEHGINIEIPECTYIGPCIGTCPECEKELFQINDWINKEKTEVTD